MRPVSLFCRLMKGQGVPRQAEVAQGGSGRSRLPDFHDGGKVVTLTHWPSLPPGVVVVVVVNVSEGFLEGH
jgi:hypothetical protein